MSAQYESYILPLSVVMSIMLAMCDFAIGIFLLLAIRRKLISKIALLVMSVMTLITRCV